MAPVLAPRRVFCFVRACPTPDPLCKLLADAPPPCRPAQAFSQIADAVKKGAAAAAGKMQQPDKKQSRVEEAEAAPLAPTKAAVIAPAAPVAKPAAKPKPSAAAKAAATAKAAVAPAKKKKEAAAAVPAAEVEPETVAAAELAPAAVEVAPTAAQPVEVEVVMDEVPAAVEKPADGKVAAAVSSSTLRVSTRAGSSCEH